MSRNSNFARYAQYYAYYFSESTIVGGGGKKGQNRPSLNQKLLLRNETCFQLMKKNIPDKKYVYAPLCYKRRR